jgi:hypothetical protein
MSLDAPQSEAARRLSAAIAELRAEAEATRDALMAVMADDAARSGLPAGLAAHASMMVGLDASGTATAHPMRRISDWAEGLLHEPPPGTHTVTRRRDQQY